MPDLVLQLGSTTSYSGGVQRLGRAPAKVTIGVNDGVFSNIQNNYLRWTLPADDVLVSVAIFRAPHSGTPVFPGGSPKYIDGRVNHYKDTDPTTYVKPKTVYDYWVVTLDKYGNPFPITVANATYIGFA